MGLIFSETIEYIPGPRRRGTPFFTGVVKDADEKWWKYNFIMIEIIQNDDVEKSWKIVDTTYKT